MENPYKETTQKHRALELYRQQNYRVKGSEFHALYILSHTKVDSDLRKDGFVIECETIPGSDDKMHVMTHDPYRTTNLTTGTIQHRDSDTEGGSVTVKTDKPVFGMHHCEKHKHNYPLFQKTCEVCDMEKIING